MEIRAIKLVVLDAVKRGRIDRQEAEDTLSRIESAEAQQAEIQRDSDATEEQKREALANYNEASVEAADLLNKI